MTPSHQHPSAGDLSSASAPPAGARAPRRCTGAGACGVRPRTAVAGILTILLSATVVRAASVPPTEQRPVTTVMHGESIVDPYAWLEALESESTEVRDWTTRQNDRTRAMLDGIPGRPALERRLTALLRTPLINAPVIRGPWLFNTERPADRNQARLLVRQGVDGAPRVLIDPEAIDPSGLTALDWFEPSHDGSLVAFGFSHAGDEMSVLRVLRVETGEWLADEIAGKVYAGGWAPDGSGLLYGVLEDPSNAYSRAWKFHRLGRHHRHDPVLVRQSQPSRIPDAKLSKDGRWAVVQEFEGWSRQDIYLADALRWLETGEPDLVPVAVGLDARFEPQFFHEDRLYLLTTLDAPNGRLIAVDVRRPGQAQWQTIIPASGTRVLESADVAGNRIVAIFTENASSRIEQYALDGRSHGGVDLPGLGSATVSTDRDAPVMFLSFTSYNDPRSIWRISLADGARTLFARPEVPVDPAAFIVRQEWCTSKDGTRVPMFLVHRRDLHMDGRRPTAVYGYGGFNVSILPRFVSSVIPFLEAGGVYASVTLRGGGEFGERWHRSGMLESKQNVFDDLYAATEWLHTSGITAPAHTAVYGGSNGGLLTGVAAVQRPDLYAAAVSIVPLLDMLRFPHFLMARFWIPEYGDPDDSAAYRWIRAYSPYHNVVEGRTYPSMLITAGENDNRVHPFHARKMTALLQEKAGNDPVERPILLWVDREAGHGQGKPLAQQVRDAADIMAFMAWRTGLPLDALE
ncbi:MAG: S9 family peptidase [Phycisphaeraceae bacterium]|nr:S9 family peptidase [Phycisphaeraceae bacterium]